MSLLSNTAVATTGQISSDGLYLFKADGTVLSGPFYGPGDDVFSHVAISKEDNRIYLTSHDNDKFYVYDQDLTLIATADGGNTSRNGFELDSVCVPCRGKVWGFASYNLVDGAGASIYEYDANGTFLRVVVELGPGLSLGRMRNIWSAVKIGTTLYYIANSNEDANVPPGTIFAAYNFRDIDGAIHRFDLTSLVDLPDLQPIATAPYVAVARDARNALYASIGDAFRGGAPPDNTVEKYVADVLVATFTPGLSGQTGIAVDAVSGKFWLIDGGDAHLKTFDTTTGASAGDNVDGVSFSAAVLACPLSVPPCSGSTTTIVPVPPATTAAPQTNCSPQTQIGNGGSGAAGCNTGGVGWTSSYSGPYGTVPQHADPDDGETLTDKVAVDLWMELAHVDVPDESPAATVYRRSLVEISDEGQQRVQEGLVSIGDTEHGLGNEQGGFEAASVDIEYADQTDRLVRTIQEDSDLEGDELTLKLQSSPSRAAGEPPHILMRAVVQKPSTVSALSAKITAVDALFADFGPFGPDRQWPDRLVPAGVWQNTPPDSLKEVVPVVYGEKSDEGAVDPVTNTPRSKGVWPLLYVGQQEIDFGSDAPAPTFDPTIPAVDQPTLVSIDGAGTTLTPSWVYVAGIKGGRLGNVAGEASIWTDSPIEIPAHAVGVLFNAPAGTDQIDSYVIYHFDNPGWHPILNPTATANVRVYTHDNLTRDGGPAFDFLVVCPDYTTSGQPFTGTFSLGLWDAYVVGLGPSFRHLNLYGSDLGKGDPSAQHDRTLIDTASRGGSDVLGPDWPNWPFPQRYVEYVTPAGETLWLDMIFARGPLSDDHKNGVVNLTVNLIGREDVGDGTGLPLIHAHRIEQHWLENCVMRSVTSGGWATTADYPQWGDGTPKVRSSSFTTRETFVISALGGVGLTAGWGARQPKAMADWVAEWNASTESRIGVNHHGQLIVWGLDDTLDPSTWPRIDHVTRIFGAITRTSGEERENVVVGSCDWDEDAQRFRIGPGTYTSSLGVAKYKGHQKQGDPINSTILNDGTQLAWVLQRRLARLQLGTALLDVPGDLGLLDLKAGDGLLLTTIEGTGAAGYVDRPCLILRRKFSHATRIVTLTLWDVDKVLTATRFPNGLDQLFVLGDEDTSPATARPLGDETAVPVTALVLR